MTGDAGMALTGLVLLALPLLPVVRPSLLSLARKAWPGRIIGLLGFGQPSTPAPVRTPQRATLVDVAILLCPVYVAPLLISPCSIMDAGLGAVLFALTLFDLRLRRLPDGLTLPLLIAGLPVAARNGELMPSVLTALATLGIVTAIGATHRILRGTEGLGGGDRKLMTAMAVWLGPFLVAQATVVAALAALAVEVLARVTGWWKTQRLVPFGAYLAGATWLVWWLGRIPSELPQTSVVFFTN